MRRMVNKLQGFGGRVASEDELQEAVAKALRVAGYEQVEREAQLKGGRIDLRVTCPDEGVVGIECKIGGSRPELLRQLARYVEHGEVDGLIVVSTKSRHMLLPTTFLGYPLWVVYWMGGL